MNAEAETPDGAVRKRRRSRKPQRTSGGGDWQARLQRQWRSALVPAMILLSLGWLGYTYLRTYQDTFAYGPASAGMSTAEVLYINGQPTSKTRDADRERWIYRSGSQLMTVDFVPDGPVRNVLCTSQAGSAADCPLAHRVALGMTEDEVWYLLGKPPVQKLDGPSKIIAYPDLGLTLRLEQFRVASIARQPEKSRFAIIPHLIRILVP